MGLLEAAANFVQTTRRPRTGYAVLRHWGIYGLFPMAILDSTPIPTFGGPDILTAILAARHGEPWYYYATAATLGWVIGAYITFRFGHRGGWAYLKNKFGGLGGGMALQHFKRWGAGALVLSTLIPFPSPTSAFFAAAGALDYPLPRYVLAVALARAVRYSAIAAIASHYGGHFIRVLRHPVQYVGWVALIVCVIGILVAGGIYLNRWLREAEE